MSDRAPDVAYLTVAGLAKSFGATAVLNNIDLVLRRGELLALLGPSGCGKSTLLKIIAGLLDANSGDVTIEGQSLNGVPAHRRDIGVVFQNYALFPHMTVRANVRFGLEMRGISRAEADRRADEALSLVQLAGLEFRRPEQLSGGQQQRVAVARAMVIRPRLLLLDEPLSNLDARLRAAMRVDIRQLHLGRGLTTILVTHDQAEAMTMADRVAVMAKGRIEQIGTPEQIYHDPATAFVAGFVGDPPASLLPVTAPDDGLCLAGGAAWRPSAEMVADLLATGRAAMKLSLRPENLAIGPASHPHAIPGDIAAVEFLGSDRLVHVQVGDFRIVVRSGSQSPLPAGAVGIVVPPRQPLFDATSGQRIR